MFLQGLYAALLSWRNSHVGSTWSWYMMWSGEIFFRSLERLNFWLVWPWSINSNLRDRNNSPIAVCAVVLFCQSRFTRLCYFADRDLRDRVIFSWSRVRTPAKQYDLFYWSWVRFPGQIACFRPVWFMAYVMSLPAEVRWFNQYGAHHMCTHCLWQWCHQSEEVILEAGGLQTIFPLTESM